MPKPIIVYAKDPERITVNLAKYRQRVQVRALSQRPIEPPPTLMGLETPEEVPDADTSAIDQLDSQADVGVEIARGEDLNAEDFESLIETVDRGDHELTISLLQYDL